MKTKFTKDEAVKVIHYMQEEFDAVRIVNPDSRQVLSLDNLGETQEICHTLWGRCERCENCTSLRALKSKRTSYKIEFINNKVFLIISKYMNINDNEAIMEIVSDASEDFLVNSDEKDKIAEIIRHHNHLVISDELTGLYNRRFLNQYFIPSLNCCHNENITINLAILDIDKFKNVNDKFGHLAGDQMLRDVAGFWKLHFDSRERNHEHIVIRYGGDEMMIIACGIPFEEFKSLLEQDYHEMRKVCYFENEVIPFTLSFGLATTEELTDHVWDFNTLFAIADKRLYESKNSRNYKK